MLLSDKHMQILTSVSNVVFIFISDLYLNKLLNSVKVYLDIMGYKQWFLEMITIYNLLPMIISSNDHNDATKSNLSCFTHLPSSAIAISNLVIIPHILQPFFSHP